MKYGVIICPKCHQVKGVLLTTKTSRCTKCNKIILLKKSKIYFKTNSQQELTEAIGQTNKNISDK
jgi:phage FluMu protein Com